MIPKMPALGLDPRVGTGSRKRSCSNNKIERGDDSKKSRRALGRSDFLLPVFPYRRDQIGSETSANGRGSSAGIGLKKTFSVMEMSAEYPSMPTNSTIAASPSRALALSNVRWLTRLVR